MAHDDSGGWVERLQREILIARERVYRFGQATPLERLALPEGWPEVWVKREDASQVKSYKWRGACNRMALLDPHAAKTGVVTASAGNHAQGVALAARALGIRARILMPRSTPRVKQQAVLRHGGEWVEVRLAGDTYDDAVRAARVEEAETGAVYIHAYDDLHVMAGQGTLADEVILSGCGPFDAAVLQIGGGGMAAGVSTWLKSYWPGIEIIGVEGEGQASMAAAFAAGGPVDLAQLDLFCDGTAVRRAGSLPYAVCRNTLDRLVQVSNAEVCQAMRILWDGLRCIAEPAGALGLAGVLQQRQDLVGKRVLVVLCGANIDFTQLGWVAQSSGASAARDRTLRIGIPEQPGAMLALLDRCLSGVNITDFQYGKTDIHHAWPIFTVSAEEAGALEQLDQRLEQAGYAWSEVTGAVDVAFRAIPLRADLLEQPVFLRLDFHERPGALRDFLANHLQGRANLGYFNYRQSGERIGRALIGIEFPSASAREAFLRDFPASGDGYRLCEPVDFTTRARLLGGS